MLETEKSEYLKSLYESYAKSLWGYAYSLSGKQDIADDTIQTVYLNMAKHIDTLQNITDDVKLKAYLNTAVRNTFYNVIQKEQRYKNRLSYEDLNNEISDGDFHEKTDTNDLIHSMLATLNQREKDILTLYYFVGLSTKEIAEVMNLSVSNIKVILHNTRKKLKQKFDRRFYE